MTCLIILPINAQDEGPTDVPEEAYPTDEVQPETVGNIAWKPDDSQIALSIAPSQCNESQNDYSIRLFDVNTNIIFKRLNPYARCKTTSLQWLNGGTHLAFTRLGEGFFIVDVTTGKVTYFMTKPIGFYLISRALVSPDTTKFVGFDEEIRTLQVWQLPKNLTKQENQAPNIVIQTITLPTDISWSPDSQKFASANVDGIWIWNANTGEAIANYPAYVNLLRWSPDGMRLASTNNQNQIQIWDAANGHLLTTMTGHTDLITALEWLPSGLQVSSSSIDRTIRIWNISTGQETHLFSSLGRIYALGWNSIGTQLAYDDGSIERQITIVNPDLFVIPTFTPTPFQP